MFLAGFILSALDFRFGWLVLADWVSWFGTAAFLISYALYAEVLRENVWLSRTIQVQENQRVVDTGLYAVVRHPMYAVTVILFLSIPLVLGSLISLAVFLAYPFIIAKRIRDEEKLLEAELRATSQRVNLFEKVKIPETEANIKKISIYMADQQVSAVVRSKISKRKIALRNAEAAERQVDPS